MLRFLGLEELYVAIPWLGGAVCRDSLAWRNPVEPRGGQEDARNGPEEARRGQKRPRKRLERAHGCQESRGKASRAQARASQICVSAGVLEMHHYLSSDSPSIEQGSAAGAQPDGFESPGPGAPHRRGRDKKTRRRDEKATRKMGRETGGKHEGPTVGPSCLPPGSLPIFRVAFPSLGSVLVRRRCSAHCRPSLRLGKTARADKLRPSVSGIAKSHHSVLGKRFLRLLSPLSEARKYRESRHAEAKRLGGAAKSQHSILLLSALSGIRKELYVETPGLGGAVCRDSWAWRRCM